MGRSGFCGKWLLIGLLVAVVGCQQTESDSLNEAQECLDKVSESNPQEALNCLTPIQGYDSQQANILKCSIYITSGGLMESKIVEGYNILEDKTQTNKAASFMAVLNLNTPDVVTGYDTAVTASQYCDASGVPGLKYLSDIVVAGSLLAKTMSQLNITGTSGVDPSNPSSVNSAVQNLISQCGGASPPADCTTNIPALAPTVVSLSASYCSTSSADQTVCDQINSAIAASGGSSAAEGQALLCALGNKTYSASDGQCH